MTNTQSQNYTEAMELDREIDETSPLAKCFLEHPNLALAGFDVDNAVKVTTRKGIGDVTMVDIHFNERQLTRTLNGLFDDSPERKYLTNAGGPTQTKNGIRHQIFQSHSEGQEHTTNINIYV